MSVYLDNIQSPSLGLMIFQACSFWSGFTIPDIYSPIKQASEPTIEQLFYLVTAKPLLFKWGASYLTDGLLVCRVHRRIKPLMPFPFSSLHSAFWNFESYPVGRELPGSVPALFLCIVLPKCVVFAAIGSYCLVLAGNQEGWQEPVLFWGTLGPS